MAFRTWGRLLLTALGVSLLAGAGQLGIAFGFGVVRLTGVFTGGTVNQWPAQLAWVGWFAANAAVVGAVVTERLARRDGPLTGGRQLAVAAGAALGSTVVAPLCMQPARAADLISVDPVWAVAICAILGAAVGAGAALAVLVRPPLGWNMALVAGAVWLLALVSVAPSLTATGQLTTVRLGVLEPSWLDAAVAQRLSLLVLPLVALLAGAVSGSLARWRGHPPLIGGLTGVAGPVLLAFAYLTAGPGDGVDRYQTTPYYGALLAVAAGVLGSAAAALLRWPLVERPAGPAADPAEGATDRAIEPTDILRPLPAGPALPSGAAPASPADAGRAGYGDSGDAGRAGNEAYPEAAAAGAGDAGTSAGTSHDLARGGVAPAHWDWPASGGTRASARVPKPGSVLPTAVGPAGAPPVAAAAGPVIGDVRPDRRPEPNGGPTSSASRAGAASSAGPDAGGAAPAGPASRAGAASSAGPDAGDAAPAGPASRAAAPDSAGSAAAAGDPHRGGAVDGTGPATAPDVPGSRTAPSAPQRATEADATGSRTAPDATRSRTAPDSTGSQAPEGAGPATAPDGARPNAAAAAEAPRPRRSRRTKATPAKATGATARAAAKPATGTAAGPRASDPAAPDRGTAPDTADSTRSDPAATADPTRHDVAPAARSGATPSTPSRAAPTPVTPARPEPTQVGPGPAAAASDPVPVTPPRPTPTRLGPEPFPVLPPASTPPDPAPPVPRPAVSDPFTAPPRLPAEDTTPDAAPRPRHRALPDLTSAGTWEAFGTTHRTGPVEPRPAGTAGAPAGAGTGRAGTRQSPAGAAPAPRDLPADGDGTGGPDRPGTGIAGAAAETSGAPAPRRRGLFRRNRSRADQAAPATDGEQLPAQDEEFVDWVAGLGKPLPDNEPEQESGRRSLRSTGRHHAD